MVHQDTCTRNGLPRRDVFGLTTDCAPESQPLSVAWLISLAWPGISHAQLMDHYAGSTCVDRCGRSPGSGTDGLTQFRLMLSFADASFELLVYVRHEVPRRKRARRRRPFLAPARDVRQQSLF